MTVNINEIILGLDKVADAIAAQSIPGNKDLAVKFFRQAAYAMRTTFGSAKIWYSPVDCTDTIASAGTTINHLWDSVEEFFGEADWVDYGDIMQMNRSMDISPVWGVVLPTARNEDGTIVAYETRIFSSLEEATAARDEAMKENDQ
jgi:hypothetical protein